MRYNVLAVLFCLIFFSSCFDEEKYSNSKRGNFDAVWKIMDEKYCFFEYKDVDWDEVYRQYSTRVSDNMSNDELFSLLAEMLAEVKDGHVNLVSYHDVARYWAWFEDYPDNFDEKIQRNYLGTGTDYQIAGGLKYRILAGTNIGYVYYESFSTSIGESNIDQVLYRLSDCAGIIFDVRNNGGGYLSNSEKLADRFFREKTLVGYIMHKTGPGHNEFSKPVERYVEPPSGRFNCQNKVVVLTNRKCYSATNDFVNAISYAPNVIVMGDKTGGGSGLPFSSEIPNGWSLRFSASPMLNVNKEHTEFGINPDIKVDMLQADMDNGIDTIIEAAKNYIMSH